VSGYWKTNLAWFVLDTVGQVDLSAVYDAYRADGWGRAAFDPQMMVALLLYGYAIGERSSRGIEQRLREDVAFRVIVVNQSPGHATIARFRVRHEQALAEMFTQILALCAKAGLVSVGLVALDGTRIAANAAQSANRTQDGLREEVEQILAEAGAIDAAEDQQFGETRGDELPAALADRRSRLQRLRCCREELEAEHAQAQAAYAENLRWRAQWEAEHARKLGGRKPIPPDPDALSKRKINTTDPDSRVLPRVGKAAVLGYNAQAVACAGQIVLAAEITQQTNLRAAGADARRDQPVAGSCWHHRTATGRARRCRLLELSADRRAQRARHRSDRPDQGRNAQHAPQGAAKAGSRGATNRRATGHPDGAALYRRRQQIIEPIFANTKFLRRIDRFHRRGLQACKAEWRLIAATHNPSSSSGAPPDPRRPERPPRAAHHAPHRQQQPRRDHHKPRNACHHHHAYATASF
jgi:transposase